ARAKLEHTGRDHLLAGLQAVDDVDEVTPGRTQSNKLLTQHLLRLSTRVLLLLDDEHRVAVRRVGNGRDGNRENVDRGRKDYFDDGEHAGAEFFAAVLNRRLHADVAGGRIDLGIESVDVAGEGFAWRGVSRHPHLGPGCNLREPLLREGEINI